MCMTTAGLSLIATADKSDRLLAGPLRRLLRLNEVVVLREQV